MLSDYNGWSGRDRERADRRLKAALKHGLYPELQKPTACEICGYGSGIMLHAEEYGPTMNDYIASLRPVCAKCHGMIHVRFRFPGIWSVFKARIKTGEKPKPVAHIAAVFGACRGWTDCPVVESAPNGTWWDGLPLVKYTGARKSLA
jgi:hypothetical protein